MRNRCVERFFLVFFFPVLPFFGVLGQADPDFAMDMKVLAVPADLPNDINIHSERTQGFLSSDGKAPVLVISPPAAITIGSVKINLDRDAGIVWEAGQKTLEDLGISTLMNGRVLGQFGQEAVVRSMSNMQYMQRLDEGRFELKTLTPEEGLGITLGFEVAPPLDRSNLNFMYRMVYTRSKGREDIPGVSLPIGKPILDTETIEAEISAELDVWVLVTAIFVQNAGSEAGDILLVFLRPHRET